MQTVVTLSYAPKPRRSSWRTVVVLLALSATVYAGYCGYSTLRQRIAVLTSDPNLGPIDWWAVLSSPTLLKCAWQLSSNPQALEQTAILGNQLAGIDIELKLPMTYRNEKVQLELVISNSGAKSVIVPPYTFAGGPIPRRVGCMWPQIFALPKSYLGNGVQVLQPGDKTTLLFEVRADPRPASTFLVLFLLPSDRFFEFRIAAGGGYRGRYPYPEWKDVPRSAVTVDQPRTVN